MTKAKSFAYCGLTLVTGLIYQKTKAYLRALHSITFASIGQWSLKSHCN